MLRSIAHRGLPLLLLALTPALALGADPASPSAEPEPEVLIPKGARHGGWGGPVVTVSTLRDRTAVFLGGRGGWIIDGRLTIGGGGFGLVNPIAAPAAVQVPGEALELAMGYGGLWLEYTFAPVRLLHLSVGTLVGGGGLSLRHHDGGSAGGDDGFFVAEPAVTIELNLATAVRVDLGATYRFVEGVNMDGLVRSDVSGYGFVTVLKFGKF